MEDQRDQEEDLNKRDPRMWVGSCQDDSQLFDDSLFLENSYLIKDHKVNTSETESINDTSKMLTSSMIESPKKRQSGDLNTAM